MAELRPNIVFINVDQMCQRAISAFGCNFVNTPNIDRLIANGISFMHSYASDPVCMPARTSWWTGKYASEHGVIYNSTNCPDNILDLGQYLNGRNYNAIFVGKSHFPGRNIEQSFKVTHEGSPWGVISDRDVTMSARGVIRNYRSKKPLFLNIGYLNPHDCCIIWKEEDIEGKPEIMDEYIFTGENLPPLPATYHYDNAKSATVETILGETYRTQSKFDDIDWRYYIYKYYRLCEMVDFEIGSVIDEIINSDMKENTIIIFSSDHGDNLAGHRLYGKNTLWDESVKVPLIFSTFSDNIRITKGKKDYECFANGVDIFPTVCDMAGLETPDGLSGMSLLGAIYGRGLSYKREYAYSEALYYSRMIRSDRYKYIMDFKPQGSKDYQPPNLHSHQILREILYDMQQHDADRVNLSERKEYKRILVQHREMLAGIESELNQITLPEGLGRETLFHRLQKYVNSFSN